MQVEQGREPVRAGQPVPDPAATPYQQHTIRYRHGNSSLPSLILEPLSAVPVAPQP